MMGNAPPSTERTDNQKPRTFRWRMIPATLLGFFSVFGFLAGIGMPIVAVYVNFQHGWIVAQPETPRANLMALNLTNLTIWQLYFWGGVVATISTFAWVRGRWYVAWGTMLLAYVLIVISNVLTNA